MGATIKAILRQDKARVDGTAPLWIRITAQRKSRYVSTGIFVDPKYWNASKAQVRKSHPIAPALNARLDVLVLEAQEQALGATSADMVKAGLRGVGGASLRTSCITSSS